MSKSKNKIVVSFVNHAFRVCLMLALVLSLQVNLVNDVFDFFDIDIIEFSEDFLEKEKESENEESDIDDHIQEHFGIGHLDLSLVNPFQNRISKITSHDTDVLTPPPDRT